jgi:pimeloyl-ACP methyl ester carboxylesterase
MTMYQVENNLVNVNIQGSGEPILFLHGVPDTSEIWTGMMSALSGNYQCIAPDLPGFGLTQASRRFQYNLDNLARFVKQLLVRLDTSEKVHLVAHDIGGIVGLAFAAKYPDKVKSLTIMDTTFFSDHKWHSLARIWRRPILGDLAMHLMGYKQFYSAMKKAAPTQTKQQIRSNYDMLTFSNRRMILKFYRTLDPQVFKGWEDKLLEVTRKIPTQVIWGEQDSFLPVELASRFGTDKVHILKGTGHWPMLDRETEVATIIRQHIDH